MPTIQIDGVGSVQVGPEFGQMSPDDQNAFIAHIADQAKGGIQSSLRSAPPVQASAVPAVPPTPTGPVQDLPRQPWNGGVLPVSSDSEGNIRFDANAGLLGALKSAATLPGDVYQGNEDLSSPQGFDRAMGMAATITPMPPVARMRPAIASDVPAPSAGLLKSTAREGYNAVRDAGVDYNSGAVASMAGALRSDLENNHGISAELAPKSFGILSKLENPPVDSVAPISGLEAARRSFNTAAKDYSNPTEQLAAQKLRDGLESFVSNPPPNAVPPGQFDKAVEAAGLLSDARANYAAAKRSELLTKIGDDAELNAKVANSGMNVDNALRQKVAGILKDPKKSAGFNEDELAALNEVAAGTPTRNALRMVSNLLGGGGGLGSIASGTAGAFMGGPAGAAILPTVGFLTKKATGRLTENALNAADELVRQRSPAYQGLLANAAPVPIPGLLGSAATRSGLLTAMDDPRRRRSNSRGY